MKNYNDFVPAEERIESRLLSNHIHFLTGDIDEISTLDTIKWIMYENLFNDKEPLTLYINSDGGSLQDAFALIDVMKLSVKPIRTIGIGSVCSAAFLIFAAGTKGERIISSNASIMCHQYSNASYGKYHDIKAANKENELLNERMISLLKYCTNLDSRTIKSKLLPPSDVWFSAQEVLELGIADKIL